MDWVLSQVEPQDETTGVCVCVCVYMNCTVMLCLLLLANENCYMYMIVHMYFVPSIVGGRV